MELFGIDYLRNKLTQKRLRVRIRYSYYEMKNVVRDFGISTPDGLKNWFSCLGWCAKGVDSLADRLQFREFRNDMFNLNEIYRLNNPDVLFDSAIKSALISSCCFLYISPDETGFPRMQVIDGGNATGIIDPVTNLLTEGYAVLRRSDAGNILTEAYFSPNSIEILHDGVKQPEIYKHSVPYALLAPVIFRPDAARPFGHSQISRACMSIVQSAVRTIKRSEIASEFYSFPQKYVSGLAQDSEIDKWRAAMSSMMTFTKDEDGDKPQVGQFTQQSMTPHAEQLRMFASLFAGEVNLTLDDLGFATENPASSEAIKAAHENLRLTARKAQKTFGSGFLNAGYLAACLRDNQAYTRGLLYRTVPMWEPIFEPDLNALSLIGDGAIKINQAVPGYFDGENLRDLIGIEPAEESNDRGYRAGVVGEDQFVVSLAD